MPFISFDKRHDHHKDPWDNPSDRNDDNWDYLHNKPWGCPNRCPWF